MAKKAYIGVENFTPRELPNGYTQVEYIESSGTQYIDTGFKPKGTTKIICDFQMVNQGTEQQGVFGSRPGASGRFTVFTGDSTGALQVDYDTYGALAEETSTISGLNLNNRNTIEVNNSLIINKNTVKTVSAVSFTSTYNLFLFANNNVGTAQLPGSMKLYSFKIYDNGTLIRDFVPCIKDDETVGLYDLVNGGFYQNAGTGTFSAGSVHGSFARKIKKGYVGVKQASSYTLESNGTRDFTDGSVSVTSFSTYQINSNGTLTPGDPTTTTLDELWQYIESGAKDLYFYFTGESSITECYELYDYGLGNRTEYVYSVNVYTVTGSNFVQVAHKIKKAYIGVGGVARPCWAGGTITKYGTIDATSDKIENSAGASNGDYAIFAGGRIYTATGNGTQTDSVFAYSKSLTLSKPDVLYTAVMDLSATNVGDYAVFAGGQLATTTDYKRYVTAYDKSLTRTFPSTLYNNACRMSAANAGGNYAVFVGGYPAEYGWTAYDSSLTMKTGDMANYRYSAAATSLGDCAVFAGGAGDGILSSCETIDSSLTRTTRGDLSVARYELSAAHVGKYAIFAGGYNQKGPVDVYNESFTRSALGNIATDGSRYHIAATQVDGFAIFAGGVYSLTVDLYDESLTHTLAENLTNDRAYSCAASVGDYALIFGGRGTLNGEDVEIYMLA